MSRPQLLPSPRARRTPIRLTALAVALTLAGHASVGLCAMPEVSQATLLAQVNVQSNDGPATTPEAPVKPTQPVGQAPAAPDTKQQSQVAAMPQPGVLTAKGGFVLEPSFQFSQATNSRVLVLGLSVFNAAVIGLIDIRTVDRSSYVAALTGRYGLTNRMEVELRVPYVYRSDTTTARPFEPSSNTEKRFDATGSGIGDVELTTRYQLNQGGLDKPYYVGSLRFKSRTGKDPFEVETTNPFTGPGTVETELPTGSGFYAIQPGLTVLYPSDPAVLFASLNYAYNFSRDNVRVAGESQPSKVSPGSIIGFNFGMGLALNDRSSLSMGYDHAIIGKTKINGEVSPLTLTSHVGTLIFGYSFRWTEKTNANLSLGVGATRDAPDIQITLRFPYTF